MKTVDRVPCELEMTIVADQFKTMLVNMEVGDTNSYDTWTGFKVKDVSKITKTLTDNRWRIRYDNELLILTITKIGIWK